MEEKKNEGINDKDGKLRSYECIVSIWSRMDESYWTSVNVFILIVGLLLAGYSQIIGKSKPLSYVYCTAGILICLIWLFILHKKIAFIYIAEDIGRNLERAIYSDLQPGGFFTRSKKIFLNAGEDWFNEFFKRRKIFTKVSAAFLTSFILPAVIIAVWVGILIATWVYL